MLAVEAAVAMRAGEGKFLDLTSDGVGLDGDQLKASSSAGN